MLVSLVRLSALLSAAAQLSVSIDRDTGAYEVVVGGAQLSAPNATGLLVGGAALTGGGGGLVLYNVSAPARGRDALGTFEATTFDWAAAAAPGTPLKRDVIKVYEGGSLAAFE